MLEHVRTLYTPRTATQNIYSAPIFVVQLRLQDFALFDYLPVDGFEDATGVIGRESVWGTGSSFGEWGGREGRTGLTWNQISNPVHVSGFEAHHGTRVAMNFCNTESDYVEEIRCNRTGGKIFVLTGLGCVHDNYRRIPPFLDLHPVVN